MKKLTLATLTLLSLSSYATGSISCKVDNKDVLIEAEFTTARMFGSPLMDPSSLKVEIKNDTSILGLPDYEYKSQEINKWEFGDDLNFAAIVEPEVDEDGEPLDFYTSLSVIVKTSYDSEVEAYVGTYVVEQASNSVGPGYVSKELKGEISCQK